jgi:LacI family transcriptional regulator
MTTIRDVAKRAGVAPITVSRVLNDSGYVSDHTRTRVQAAVDELHYVPSMLARSLRSHHTDTLALVLTDVTNPFWTTVARGVEDAASQQGYNVILCNTDEQESKQDRYLSLLLRRRVDGFLFVPARSTPRSVRSIQKQGIPVVVLDRQVPGARVDMVRGASEQGAYALVHYLLSLGHRRIAILAGPEGVSTAAERVDGYLRAFAEAGLTADPALIFHGEFTVGSGYQMAQDALAVRPNPTALFATNNFIAISALKALRERNLRVPEDVSLVSFDDLPSTLVVEPFLTVAAQPAYEMGRRATELLLERITDPAADSFQEIVLPTALIVRHSCRAPAGTPALAP